MTSINNDSTLMPRTQRDTRRMNQFVSIAAAVAGLLFGLDIGVIAGALPFITDHFALSSRLQEWVVSSMMLGAAVGALFNGWLSFRLGRKYSLMVGAILLLPDPSAPPLPTASRSCCWRGSSSALPSGSPPIQRRFISLKWRVKTSAGR
ncbi:Arabinose transporter [Raoultella terrigena]|uniref:Arabinose transporter n=1 Tax=Raoultella terrigena TaxID=577 RepID=A0A4U9D1D6_RAOTE|nr:Arabinose transporter [Raoultella terrigena]